MLIPYTQHFGDIRVLDTHMQHLLECKRFASEGPGRENAKNVEQ